VIIFAGHVPDNYGDLFAGELTLLRDDATGVCHVLVADPMVQASFEMVEKTLGMPAPVKLLDVLRIETTSGPLVYVVRGIDLLSGIYFLSWPD
jgi:hypothetical protein